MYKTKRRASLYAGSFLVSKFFKLHHPPLVKRPVEDISYYGEGGQTSQNCQEEATFSETLSSLAKERKNCAAC